MFWFRISLIKNNTEFSSLNTDGYEVLSFYDIRVPSSNGKPFYPNESFIIYSDAKNPEALDAIIGLNSEVLSETPSDWMPLTIQEAELVYSEIIGKDPLPGQIL